MALLAFMALLAIFLSPSILPLYFMEFISGDQPASVQSAAKVLPLLMAKSHKPGTNRQEPSIHAGGNNLTTTREVYADQSKSAPLGSPTRTGVLSVGAETAPSTGRPNVRMRHACGLSVLLSVKFFSSSEDFVCLLSRIRFFVRKLLCGPRLFSAISAVRI